MPTRLHVDTELPTTSDLEAFLSLIAWFNREHPGCKIRVLAGGDLQNAKELVERCGLNDPHDKQ